MLRHAVKVQLAGQLVCQATHAIKFKDASKQAAHIAAAIAERIFLVHANYAHDVGMPCSGAAPMIACALHGCHR